MSIFICLIAVLLFNLALFFPAYFLNTDKLTDISYALSFLIAIFFGSYGNEITFLKALCLTMVFLWALRLGVFLFIRISLFKRDKRFDKIRSRFFRFLLFWVLQAITVWLVLLPSLFFLATNKTNLTLLSVLGLGFWLFGLLFESIADMQKLKFKLNFKNKDSFIKQGLWRYSRHPNYFGEILVWLGIYLFVFSSLSFEHSVIGLISPIFISVLLIFISGIPQLEQSADLKFGENKDYQDYKKNTNVLFPWAPKTTKDL